MMQLNKGDIIKDGEKYFSIFCILGSVIYVQRFFDVISTPVYELKKILKYYRKIETMGNDK